MSEQKPYNEEQWNDLPLPDSELAWQKMEVLLDDDKKRRGLPFWWRYAGLALLLIGVSVGAWLWIRTGDTMDKTQTATSQQVSEGRTTKGGEDNEETIIENGKKIIQSTENIPVEQEFPSSKTEPTKPLDERALNTVSKNPSTAKTISSATTKKEKRQTKIKLPQGKKTLPPIALVNDDEKEDVVKNKQTTASKKENEDVKSLSTDNNKNDKPVSADTAKQIVAPLVSSSDSSKKKIAKKAAFVWSAGIGLQQAIAVNGQQSSSYNYRGKTSALADRIPSVYLRLQKAKWFVQAEFQYAVPQPVQNFFFSQKTKFDAASLSINTERFVIQKLYYHQLPVSINYHLFPDLSFGVGGMYNILAGAVTERQLNSRNVQTGNETTTNSLAPVQGFKDSFLYKTTAGILLQTDYHWKRFSLGLRYTQNLQPFIKYTKPDGTVLDEKTNALQAVLRFRLWTSK